MNSKICSISFVAITAARSNRACSSYSNETAMLVIPKNAPSIAAAVIASFFSSFQM